MAEDSELLRRYVDERSETAFAEIVRRHIDLVFSVALRQVGGDSHLAQDVTQSVFTDLARKAASLARRPVLGGWLYRSTHFAASDVVRAERRRRAREQEAHAMQELTHASPADEIAWEKFGPVLDEVMAGLSERDRDALVLRFFEGRAFAEIGARLQLTADAARMRVDRALERIRVAFARRGVTSTATAIAVALSEHAVSAAPGNLAAVVTGSALTSAAGGGGAIAGLLQFMSTTKLTATIAGLLVVLAAGTATHEVIASRKATATLAASNREHAALAATLRELEQRAQATAAEVARLQRNLDDARAAQSQTPQSARDEMRTATSEAAPDPVAAGDAFLARHPEVRQALDDYARARVRSHYGEFFDSLELTADQIEQLETLLIAGIGMGALGPSREEMMLYVGPRPPPAEYIARLREILGPEGTKAYWEFSAWTAPAQGIAAKVAGAVFSTDTPLTPAQADQLAQLIARSRSTQRERLRTPFDRFDWEAITAKAAGVLTAPQLAALADLKAEMDFNEMLNRPPADAKP